jgi:hypothetical protein
MMGATVEIEEQLAVPPANQCVAPGFERAFSKELPSVLIPDTYSLEEKHVSASDMR